MSLTQQENTKLGHKIPANKQAEYLWTRYTLGTGDPWKENSQVQLNLQFGESSVKSTHS